MNNKVQYTLSNLLVIVVIVALSYYYMAKFVYNNNGLELAENFMNSGLTYSITDPNNYFINNTNVDTSLPFLQFPKGSSYEMTLGSIPTFIGKSFVFEGFYKITGLYSTSNRFLQLFEINSNVGDEFVYKLVIGLHNNDNSKMKMMTYAIQNSDTTIYKELTDEDTGNGVNLTTNGTIESNYIKIKLTYNVETEKVGTYEVVKADRTIENPNNSWTLEYDIVDATNATQHPTSGYSVNFTAPIFAMIDKTGDNARYTKNTTASTLAVNNSILKFSLTNLLKTINSNNDFGTSSDPAINPYVTMYKCSIKNNI